MQETLTKINSWSTEEAEHQLYRCCGVQDWVTKIVSNRPYSSWGDLLNQVDVSFSAFEKIHWLEAFAAHPKIGDIESLRQKYASSKTWSTEEQSSMVSAAEELILDLARMNQEYEQKHGFIFIVFATGKSPREMLTILKQRIDNDTLTEIKNAAAEQRKITNLRLEKL